MNTLNKWNNLSIINIKHFLKVHEKDDKHYLEYTEIKKLIRDMLTASKDEEFIDLREINGRLIEQGYNPTLVNAAINSYKNLELSA